MGNLLVAFIYCMLIFAAQAIVSVLTSFVIVCWLHVDEDFVLQVLKRTILICLAINLIAIIPMALAN